MRILVPDYYKDFKCLAGSCQHSCCTGWEVDIDRDTLAYYRTVDGEIGQKLKDSIATDGETTYFCMTEDKKCPFLNENGLCDIMIELGPDKVSQICDDHPRFRNFYSDRTEIGLGLSCEAVAPMIVSKQDKTQLLCIEDGEELLWEGECDFLDLRDDIFDILQNREKAIDARIDDMLNMCDVSIPEKSPAWWADILYGLEKLEDSRDCYLDMLKSAAPDEMLLPDKPEIQIALEQLAIYFVYRHLTDGLDDDMLPERIAFAAFSTRLISWIIAVMYNRNNGITAEQMAEICRVYSSEIEYNPDNVQALLEIMQSIQTE